MYCTNCGDVVVEEGARFCRSCGSRVGLETISSDEGPSAAGNGETATAGTTAVQTIPIPLLAQPPGRERAGLKLAIAILVLMLIAGAAAAAFVLIHRGTDDGQAGRGEYRHIVLQAVAPPGHQLAQDDVERSAAIMRTRLKKLGIRARVTTLSDSIIIELPNARPSGGQPGSVTKPGLLELYDLEPDLAGPSWTRQGVVSLPVATTSLYNLLRSVQAKAKQGTPTAYYLFMNQKRIAGPVATRAKLGDISPLLGDKVLAVPAKMTVLTCSSNEVVCPGQASGGVISPPPVGSTYYYLFVHDPPTVPELTGTDLKLSGTRQDFDPNGNPVVLLSFTGKGGQKFHTITRNEFQRGSIQRSPQHFAIVLDGEIKSFPQIDYTDSSLSDGIDPVNGAQITGLASLSEAKALAVVLQTGALPLRFIQIKFLG
jgi:preprotein translocase subunit SecD